MLCPPTPQKFSAYATACSVLDLPFLVLQLLRWRCVESAIYHERDVRKD